MCTEEESVPVLHTMIKHEHYKSYQGLLSHPARYKKSRYDLRMAFKLFNHPVNIEICFILSFLNGDDQLSSASDSKLAGARVLASVFVDVLIQNDY